ncbi:hypothetical protein COT97_00640 [Candidatus Falkowbacteria bacterium CG10_big_fil_rev_8_21_14_0_10_39_11]|uniref:N-acetylmuramoyl-L-alanine amidase n=1 Tax=Candidatus Falkowbacteria bacterium CG10_big_fil_rev_8_21_14_0_10_39_11 TaxID=1974565 RepID=A0A2H0V638_9BACT|nr:MAG: hypothetical protein COT97_00640 [Candidatus Falkowbacteria bacterium CG10_big_fil_rev_8_21_14_0_10_39_11]
MKKIALLLPLLLLLFLPQSSEAGSTKIGTVCKDSSACEVGRCQTSDLKNTENKFCVCNEAADCATAYGGTASDWQCNEGSTSAHDLNVCFKVAESKSIYPLSTDQTIETSTKVEQDKEDKKVVFTPPSLPAIGGLCNLKPVESSLGATAVFSWIGQCVAGLYSYGFMLGIMFAILMIIIGGIVLMTAGASENSVSTGKKLIFSSFFGLIVLMSSYLILSNINPNLVEFAPTELKLIDAVELELKAGEEEHAENQEDPVPGSSVPEGTIGVVGAKCEKYPTKSDGSGDKSLINILECDTAYQREQSAVTYVILHDTGRNAAGTANSWHQTCVDNNGAQGKCKSTHYVIETTGKVYQLMDESKIAYHAGTAWNRASIGIDLQRSLSTSWIYSRIDECVKACKEGSYMTKKGKSAFPGCSTPAAARQKCNLALSPAQYNSLNKLLTEIAGRTSVQLTDKYVRAHCEGSASHSDPRNLDWSKLRLGLSNAPHYTSGGKADKLCKFSDKWEAEVEKQIVKYFGTSGQGFGNLFGATDFFQ